MELLQTPEFWIGLLKIVWINIILSGDNAVVIALAARSLPPEQQKKAVLFGSGAAVVLRAGAPLREGVVRKLKIPVERDPTKLVWRMWERGGLLGLCLIAPVTIGPQATAVIALAVGEKPRRVIAAVALGVLPWCVIFAVLTAFGFKLVD
jgi:hypothetical protein